MVTFFKSQFQSFRGKYPIFQVASFWHLLIKSLLHIQILFMECWVYITNVFLTQLPLLQIHISADNRLWPCNILCLFLLSISYLSLSPSSFLFDSNAIVLYLVKHWLYTVSLCAVSIEMHLIIFIMTGFYCITTIQIFYYCASSQTAIREKWAS